MPRSKTALIVPAKNTTAVQVLPQQAVPSFMQTIKEGFAFGTGSSIARNVIDRVMSPGQTLPTGQTLHTGQTLPPSRVCHEPCILELREYENCILTQDSEAFCGDKRLAFRECIKSNVVEH